MKLPISFVAFVLLIAEMSGQESDPVDFTRLQAEVLIEPSKKEVSGEVTYFFDILQPTDSIFIDARKMDFSEVFLNGSAAEFGNNGKRFFITGNFQPVKNQELRLKYSATPSQAMYFIRKTPEERAADFQVWTQGQGKNTSHWLPSFDDPTEKLEVDMTYLFSKDKTIVANGELLKNEPVNDSLVQWQFDMEKPMSSYLIAVAAGDFEKEIIFSEGGVPMELYYPEGMGERVEPTYRHTAFLMDFFEKETGIEYPWKNYKQIPVRDFLYSGMENTGATIFSDVFLVDSIGFNDQDYVNVNAHELAHQWFGNLVTAAAPEHHWLHEGLSTYYALLAEKAIFGEEYYYYKLFKSAEELKQLSDEGKGVAVVNKNGTSLGYYQKGAWALHILNERIGKKAFDTGIKNFLEKYQYEAASTDDFLAEMEAASGKDLSEFKKDWLLQSAFQGTEALESLKKSNFIQEYLSLAAAKPMPISEKKKLLEKALSFPVNDYLGQEAVLQLALEDPSEVIDLYKKAFSSGNLHTRQAIAFSLQEIPQQLKEEFEGLLKDKSYLTKEAALYNLWLNFPQERLKYLQEMKGIDGLIGKNIRSLWLALSIATPEVPAASKQQYLAELRENTAPYHRFQLRENAFGYLYQLNAFDDQSLYNLVDATKHHTSRFRNSSRKLLKILIEQGIISAEEQETMEARVEAESGK